MSELYTASQVAELAAPLIAEKFPHLRDDCSVVFLFLDANTATDIGKVKRVGDDVKTVLSDAPDFIVTVWQNWWTDANDAQRRGLLVHLLCHCGWSKLKSKAYLVPHDFEGFRTEIEMCGAWSPELVDAQLDLDVADAAGDDEVAVDFRLSQDGHAPVRKTADELRQEFAREVAAGV